MVGEKAGEGAPRQVLGLGDATAIIVGLIIGAGIFGTPAIVAGAVESPGLMVAVWIAGGVFSVIGALCYAELATAFPNAGGEYHFLGRAYGRSLAFLYGWARMTVIVAGSIAVFAYLFGDYMSRVVSLGEHSSALWAGIIVIVLTIVNYVGIQAGKATQDLFTFLEAGGLVLIVVAGLVFAPAPAAAGAAAGSAGSPAAGQPWYMGAGIGSAMVFVLFTYGGWNDAAYISAEVRDRERNMVRALLYSIGLVTLLYVLVNIAYAEGAGLRRDGALGRGRRRSAEERLGGHPARSSFPIMIAIAALTSVNGSMIVGARSNYALGRDWPMLRFPRPLGRGERLAAQCRAGPGRHRPGAGGLRRGAEHRLQGAGRVFAAGVLGLLPHYGYRALRAAGEGTGRAAAVPRARLPGGARAVRADVRLPAVFEPRLPSHPRAGRPGGARGRRAAAAVRASARAKPGVAEP